MMRPLMMSIGKRAAVVLLLFALGLCAPVALAAKGDPQKKFTAAGRARSIAVSLKRTDFPAGWKQQPKQLRNQQPKL